MHAGDLAIRTSRGCLSLDPQEGFFQGGVLRKARTIVSLLIRHYHLLLLAQADANFDMRDFMTVPATPVI